MARRTLLGVSTRPTVLILGGTSEARGLAERLGITVDAVTSFAGRTTRPVPPTGRMRVGGFGGVTGLAEYLRSERVAAVVDATHPFAAVMPHNVAAACAGIGMPRLRLLREPWQEETGGVWHPASDMGDAVNQVAGVGGRRVFLTIGRQEIAPFARLREPWFLVRSVEPCDLSAFASATSLLARGPFDVAAERSVIEGNAIDLIVSKNSGGDATKAKLVVAREYGVPVVMVARPPQPEGATTPLVDEAAEWVLREVHG